MKGVCQCALNKDEKVGVEDQANDDSIYRRINNIYYVLVPTTNCRMHNVMVLAFGGCFADSVGCDNAEWA